MTETSRAVAPWTVSQTVKLNEWQAAGHVHPFTCPNRDDGKHEDGAVLVASTGGWFCPYCKYAQDWAHEFMLEGPPTLASIFTGEGQ